jgi:hypothetical protein
MALLRYTLLRLALLGATAGVLWLVGMRGLPLLLVALLVSGVISLVVLSRVRDEVSAALSNRVGTINRRLEEPPSPEDES